MGAAVLMRPEAGVEAGSLFALLGGALLGAYLSATRGAPTRTDPLSTLAVQCLLGAAMLAPFALVDGLPALSPGLAPERARARRRLGHLPRAHRCGLSARRRHRSGAVPLLQHDPALAAGYLWFGETLSQASLLGLGAIAAGGLVTLSRAPAPAVRIGGPRVRLG